MNITILNTALEVQSLIVGAVAMFAVLLLGYLIKRKFRKLKLEGLKFQTEKAHFHLQEANKCLQKLHSIFNQIENHQEEILDGVN